MNSLSIGSLILSPDSFFPRKETTSPVKYSRIQQKGASNNAEENQGNKPWFKNPKIIGSIASVATLAIGYAAYLFMNRLNCEQLSERLFSGVASCSSSDGSVEITGGTFDQGNLTKGTLKNFEGSRILLTTTGEFQNDLLHGQGERTKYYKNGKIWETDKGQFEYDLLHGQGERTKYNYENGKIWQTDKGQFEYDGLHGQGERTKYNENGTIWQTDKGLFEKGLLHGQGERTKYYENGMIVMTQKGLFENNMFKGGAP